MSRFQKVLTVLFCIIVLFALAPTGGAFAQTEGPFGDPTCGDYIDNDGDGNKDSADTDCYNNVGDPDVDDDGDGRTENAGDCNDDDPTIYSGALKICDGKDNNCDGKKDFTTDEDKDNDGVPWCAGDCDDNNPNRAPNIIEAPMGSPVCLDGIDNDCDNKADSVDPGCQFSCFDSDGDGYGINGDASCDFPGEIDCNDNDATINPGQTDDSCNGIDNNCSTVIDDEYVIDTLCGVGECLTNNMASSCVGGVETLCIPGSSSPEGVVGSPSCTDGLDNDCDGLSDTDPACQVSCQDFDEDGYGVLVDASCQFAGIDCDDSNALINPGGDDANCNGIDEDCVGGADSGYAVDSLCGTGECQTNNTPSSCTGGVETLCQPGTPVAEDTPGVGVCIDGVDNDCDGLIDTADSEGCSSLDVDDDGDGFTENQNDCNDADATIYPGAPKICDGKDNNCDGKRDFTTDVDADLDGVPWCAGDCDDNNPNRAPNLFEGGFGSAVCTDGIDNDCDNKIDFADPPCQGDCIDTDGDGYGVNGDVSCDIPGEIDCDDTNAAVNPAGDDANCNGIDEDCVGGADSGYVADTLCGTGECQANNTPSTCVGGVETACQPGAPVLEGPQGDPTCSGGLDEDCDDLIDGNDPGCNTPCIDQDGDGYGANGDPSCPSGAAVDCDDSNAAVNPAGDDANCNGIDEDCAGGADDGYIPDTDCGTGECQTNNTPSSCTGGVETACEPGDPGVENTPFVGACIDGLDNDCDGLIDALPGLEDPDCFDETIDNDGDGYCKAASCTDGSSPNDCDDTDPNVYPGAPKICDGKDSNCDGKKDSPTDEDKDLDGVPWCAGDCDDNDPLAYPGNTEGPFGDPTCSDGRDNDCQNGADAVDPACVVSCETSNDTKDGLHVETMRAPGPDGIPNTADDIDHPESNNLLCGKCHGATLQDPIRYACDRCHEAGGTSKAAYPDPWPFGFGSAPDVMVHSSTVVGTKYGAWDMDCLTCHNPHLQEQDRAYGTSYGKYIKEYICFDNPVTAINVEEIVEFTAPTGPGSFADGPPLNENICNMCHTQTNHHRRDDAPPAPGGQDHNNGQDCAGCHPHIDGFAPSGGEADAPHNNIANPGIFPNCSVCHVSESDFLTPVPSANCLNCHDETAPNKAGGGSDIKVRSHFIGTMECIECHNPMFAQINFRGNPNLSHVRTVVNGNQIAFEAKTGPFSFADDTNAAANGMLPENYICNTCHTATAHHRGDGSLLPADQSHNDGIDCTGCHTHQGGTIVPDAFRDHIENSQAHAPHNNTANPGLFNTCDVCHVTESDYVTPVPNTKCLNCHSVAIGQTGPVDSHHTAGDGSQCIDCHNPMREQINFRGNPNLSHIRTSINGTQIVLEAKTGDYGFAANGSVPPDMTLANYVCNTCHTQTNHHQADGTAPLGQSHNNGLDCTLCHTHPGTAASGDAFRDHPVTIADQPHNSTATPGFNDDCNLCHVDNVPPLVPIPNSKCNGCHAVGTPDQAGGGADTKLETHHTPVDSDCVECHNPMGQTGGNAYHIRLIVNGEPIVFTGVNDYAAGDGTGLCEVCHTSNTYYVNAANQPAQFPDHNVGSNCTTASCHTHETGMEPPIVLADAPHDTITDCTLCHDPGTYVDGADIDKAKCYNCHGPAGPATTVETHHTPADLNCTDCHNPMNPTGNWKHVKPTVDGATIVFGTPTTAPTAVQYADEAGNGLCEVCHDAGTLSYYNSDGSGLPHNAGAICTTCHTHPTGFVPPSAFADVPHETITDCTLCHDDGTYVDGATLNNTKCLGCHGPAGPATTVETHHTPADLNCTDCHNPMNVTGTWKHVKPTVDGSPITFGNPTTAPAAGEYADGAGNGLCEVCHDSLTLSYYNSDGSGLPHMTDVCTTCHTHDTGMVPPITPLADVPHNTITDCTQCHSGDDYADGATLDNNKCLGCHGPAGPATTVETHHTPADLNCTDCHNPMNVTGTWKHVKPTVDGTLITFGTPTTAPAAGEYADGLGNGLCEVCHDSLTLSYYNSDGSGLPHMTDVCTTCHTHDTGMVPPTTPLADVPHDTITDCTQCHSGDDYADGATLDNNKCLGCHGAAGPATTVETHHTPADLNCTDCHNPMNPTGNWKHVKPTVDGSPITFGTPTTAPTAVQYADEAGNGLCEVCHDAGTLSYYNSDGSGLPHNAGAICTTCHTHPTGFVPPSAFADVPHETITDCTLCHDDGTYVDGATLNNTKCLGCHGPAGPATTVETHHTPADLNCTDCHNPMNVTGTWKHVKPTVDGTLITFGTATTAPAAGEYADGAGNGLCEVCHDSLTLSYYNSDGSGLPHMTDVCTTCHTHDTGMVPPTTPLADVPHDTITDCTQCHSGDDYADGATLDNNKCLGCHGPAGPATTVETHHTPADLNCTDCHNPMNPTGTWKHVKPTVDGTLITFGTATTAPAAGEYADGLGNGLCEVCHDSLTLSYYNSDGSGLPHMTDVCTTCHTHDTGMVPPTTPLADVPHDTITDCTQCHSGDDYADGATLDNNKCLGCHGPAGPATTVETHHTPADLNCTDCHNPMNPTGNWKHVMPTVDGAPITFGTPTTAPTAVQYADEAGNGLCEVCHDAGRLTYYNSDGSGLPHNAGAICTTCHTHPAGFVPPSSVADVPHETITDCTLCHDDGTYVDGATLDNNKCLGCHGPAGPATTVETHHTPADLNCTDCHNPMNVTGTWKHVKPTVDGSPITFGNPTIAPAAGEYADGAGNGLCEVCHDSLTLSYYNSDGSGLPHMTDVCTTCHTHDTGMVPPTTPLADVPHDTITDCTQCHSGDDYADGATLDNNKCLGCHGPAGPATTVETHHTPADLNCTDCHNPMNATGTWRHIKTTPVGGSAVTFGTPTTAPSAGEYADGLGSGLCEVCHTSLTLDYYNSDGSGFSHNDGSVCTSCHTHDTGMAPPIVLADTPHDGITDCTLCHDPGTYVDGADIDKAKCYNCHGPAGPATTVETHHTPADLNCTDCHNPMNPTGNWKHVKPTVDGSTIVFGTPTTAPTAIQYADEAGNGLCEVCHDSLTLTYYNSDGSGLPHNAGAICTTCHTHPAGFTPSAFADVPHDGITDCTLCHDPGTYVDGATLNNSKCLGCHGPAGPATTVETHHTPADLFCTDCHNPMNVTGTYRHIKSTVDGATIVFGTPTTPATGGEYADGLGNGLCEVCHDSLTLAYYNSDGSGFSHNDGSVCTSCHTHDTGMVPPQPPADTPHDTITDCTLCHDPGTYVDDATLDNNKCLGCHGPAGPATTVETHHTPPDLNCTDCHNPMNPQGSNLSHIRTSLANFTANAAGADFADGSGNGICETCHVGTKYYNQTGTGQPHETDACTNCHMHLEGFVQPDDPADAPHNVFTDCSVCHTPGSYVLNAAIPNSKCNNCHAVGTPDAGAGGANTKVETHHTPADEDCVTCHNPMRSQGTNLSHIRTSLAVFTANAAGADFANGTGSGICETCHVSTTYYNNTGTGQPHFTDACTNCHLHEGGFVPVVEADAPHDTIPDCYYCHVVSGFSTPIPDSKCEQCHTPDGVLKDSYPSAPDVLTHSSVNHPTGSAYTYTNNCIDCHNPMYAQDGNAKHIRTTLAVFTGADYIHSDPNYDGICETCHVNTRHHRNAASQPAPIMPHNNTIPCTNCHAHEAGFIPGDAPPPPHVTQPCGTCHVTPDTYVLGAAIPNSACLSCHDLAAPGSHIIGWGDCRTESGTTDLSAGMSVRNVSLTTPISNTSKAFLLVDSSGPQSTIQGRDHMVSGYIAGTNTLTFEREGNSGIAEVSYAVVECLWDEFTVQRGEIQLNNGIASNTATISDVDPAMSMVIVNARTNIAKEEQHQALVTGKMLDQTTVEVERAASATSADTSVRYEVVEFSADSGVKIQTGEIDFNGDSSLLVHVPTPVLKESSWLYFSYDATDDGPQENAISGQLTTINRLSFYRHENSPFDNRIRYYLVEFPEQQVLVQRGVSSYQGGASQAVTHDITIPTPVSNLDKAFTFVTNTSAGRGDTLNIDPNGTFIEAENYTNTLPGAGLITETIIGGELHGGTSLVTSGGANLIKCDDIIAQNQAGIEYNVNFTTPGTYTIWMRGNSVKFTKDSHAVGFYTGTEPAEGCIAVLRQNQNRRWTWSKSTETHSAPGGVDIGSAQFTVSAPGTYKLRVWIAENGHYLDGIYIDSINSVPTTSNHGIMVDSTDPQAKLFPRNRWTEQLTSTSNIRMSNWRGETEEADADFDWQVIDFVGSPRGDSGSDMKVDRHFSDNYIDPSTGSLMDITCVECHNPMRPQSNLKFIRSTIRSNTVNFTSFYEMAGDSAPYDGVCEVCHTQTLYHRNDGTETDSDHGIGSDCRWCHKHRYGQKPVVVPAPPHDGQEYQDTCTLCHVNDINYSLPIPDSKCNACHTLGGSLYSSYPTAQIVVTHASANNPESPYNFSITCVDCHLPMWEVTNLAQIRTRIADSIVPGSDVLFTSLTGTDSFADGPPYEENICDTCHSQTNHHQSDGTAPGGQSHNDGLYCAGCHPHGDGFLYSENNCVYCHNQSPPFTSSDTDRRQIVEFIPGDGEGEFVKRSHHVINGATVEEIVRPDDCRVCHDQSNHQQFGDGQTVLVNDPDNPGVSHTYDGTGKSIEVFCLGCHDNDDSQVYGPQPFIGAGDINNPPQIGWETDVVSHSVAYTNAACFNCHGDETGAVNGHGSANPYMHKYTYVPGESHLFCYNCHDGSLNNPDVRAAFDLPFSHRTGSEECKTCHDQHKSEMGLHVEGSENLADMIGGVNKGMGFDYQYEICFQCHDIPITKTNLNSENDMDVIFGGSGVYATYWSTMPDVQSQFSTDNLAYHPLFAAGLNQPSNSLNSAWDTSPYRKDDSAPGGPFDGLDNNFVDNWKSTSLVTCSDCHGNGTVNGARGIHGSDYPWLNRRVETDKKVTTAGAGVIFPNVQGPNELHTASNFCVNCHRADIYGFGSANAEPPVWQNDFSRIDHSGSSGSYNRNCKKANIESSKGGFAKIGCSNCHGGSEVAGIHGTNLTATGPGNRQLGERFMNGNSRAGQVLSGNSVSCYATTTPEPLNVQLSSCNQHRTKASQPVDFQYSY